MFGWNSSPSLILLPFSNLISGSESGDWLICGLESCDVESEWGDWLICGRVGCEADAVGVEGGASRGWLNAPVLCFCNFSNTSCSSLGRRGGAGPDLKDVVRGVDVLKARRERRRGRRARDVDMVNLEKMTSVACSKYGEILKLISRCRGDCGSRT